MTFLGERYAYTSYDPVADDVLPEKYDPLLLTNIYINYRNIFIKGLNFGIGAYNILDSEYSFIQPYNGWHAPVPGHGREFVFKLSYTFNFK